MRDLTTVLGSKVATAFKINGVYIPAASLSTTLANFAAPALMHNEIEKYSISKSGTMLKCKLGDRYFALTAAHNFSNSGFDHQQLCLHEPKSNNLVTSSGYVEVSDKDYDEDHFDIRLYDFTESVVSGALTASGWIDIVDAYPDETLDPKDLLICIGYPGALNEIDYEKPAYHAIALLVDGFLAPSCLNERLAMKLTRNLRCHPGGFSGAPIFGLGIRHLEPQLMLHGIVTSANQNIFHFTSSKDLAGFTKKLLK